jgi:hypothetical protein
MALAVAFATSLIPNGWAAQALRGLSSAYAHVATFAGGGPIGPSGAPGYVLPLAGMAGLRTLPVRYGGVIDEDLRRDFLDCDRSDRFQGRPLAPHSGCKKNPNNLQALIKLPNGAIFMEAHLNLDLAGSKVACSRPNPRFEDCATFLDDPKVAIEAYEKIAETWESLFLANETTPFITIPLPAGNERENPRSFTETTGLQIGDLGVVFYRDHMVPVIIGNAGPAHQALAGSLGLFEEIGVSRCRAWSDDKKIRCDSARRYGLGATVVTVMFPGSKLEEIRPLNAADKVRVAAFEQLAQIYRAPSPD